MTIQPLRRTTLGLLAAAALAGCSRSASLTPAQRFAQFTEMAGITVGSPETPLKAVVFFDTQCPHCASLWDQFAPLAGSLRVRWLPVRFLGPASMSQAVALLQHARPISAFEAHKDTLRRGFSSPLEPKADDKGLEAKVRANTDALLATGKKSVPTTVYLDEAGELQYISGAVPTSQLRERLVRL